MKRITCAAILVAPIAAPAAADIDSASAEIKTWEQVDNLFWRGADLIVEVEDDGSRRDGYAESVCLELAHHGANMVNGRRVIVRIVDFSPRMIAQREVVLGIAMCPM